jgi:hypothetical protein
MPQPDGKRILSYNGAMMKEGKEAERIVAHDFFKLHSNVKNVSDLTNKKDSWAEDVDFTVTLKTGDEYKVTVKSDQHIHKDKGNFPFELLRLNHHLPHLKLGKLGWSFFSQADLFMIWSQPSEQLYVFTAAGARQSFQQFVMDNRRKAARSLYKDRFWFIETDAKRTTVLFLLPLTYMSYKVYSKFDNQWEMISESKASIRRAA